jgi:hypothetical protein
MSVPETLARITAAFDAADIAYMLTGSFAGAHYGIPRSTQDIDIVIDATESQLRNFIGALDPSRYYAELDAALEAIGRRRTTPPRMPVFTTEGTEVHRGIPLWFSLSPVDEPVLCLVAVPVHLPAEISNGGFVDSARCSRKVGGHVVLESVFADVVQQLLEVWNLDHADTTKGIQ